MSVAPDADTLESTEITVPTTSPSSESPSGSNRRLHSFFYFFLATIAGAGTVLQGGVNIALAEWIGSPLKSGFISFFVGSLCLSLSLCVPSPDRIEIKQLIYNIVAECKSNYRNCYIFFHGVLGVFFLCSAIYIAPIIGYGLYILSIVFGQITTSSLIDHFGLIWSPKRTLSAINCCGPFLAICGGVIFQIPSFSKSNDNNSWNDIFIQILCILSAVIAGICFTVQSALNRRLKVISNGSPFQSSFISFCNGTSVLIILNVMDSGYRNEWLMLNHESLDWYIFFGGMLGAFILTMFIICPSHIGFVNTYLSSIFGSMVTSLVFDYIGAFGVVIDEQQNVPYFEIIGILCVLIGAVMVNLKRDTKSETKCLGETTCTE